MRYYWDLIRHFFVANSRHGTHSPFVYDLASRVIYPVSRVQPQMLDVPVDFNPKYRSLLLDMLTYMEIKKVAYFGSATHSDALFADLGETSVDEITEVVRLGKVIIVHEPFQSRETKRAWQKLVQSADITVSINLFHFGLLMQRKEQRKENFVLRYPFWK